MATNDSPLILSRTTRVDGKTPNNVLENQRRYRAKVDKDILRDRVRRSNQKYRSRRREYERNLNLRVRLQALIFLGGKCVRCGLNDMRVLQIDHINGGGTKENKRIHARGISMKVMEEPEKYQVLCSNCNWIKRWERGENKQRILE